MKSNTAKYFLTILQIVGTIVVFVGATRFFIVEPGRINGKSMEPHFQDRDFFLINKLSLLVRKPKRGDIVQIITDDDTFLVKRVVGLPGESIFIDRQKTFITSASGTTTFLEEPYAVNKVAEMDPALCVRQFPVIPPNEYFVMGDNRNESRDSRNFGTVHRSKISGKIVTIPNVFRTFLNAVQRVTILSDER